MAGGGAIERLGPAARAGTTDQPAGGGPAVAEPGSPALAAGDVERVAAATARRVIAAALGPDLWELADGERLVVPRGDLGLRPGARLQLVADGTGRTLLTAIGTRRLPGPVEVRLLPPPATAPHDHLSLRNAHTVELAWPDGRDEPGLPRSAILHQGALRAAPPRGAAAPVAVGATLVGADPRGSLVDVALPTGIRRALIVGVHLPPGGTVELSWSATAAASAGAPRHPAAQGPSGAPEHHATKAAALPAAPASSPSHPRPGIATPAVSSPGPTSPGAGGNAIAEALAGADPAGDAAARDPDGGAAGPARASPRPAPPPRSTQVAPPPATAPHAAEHPSGRAATGDTSGAGPGATVPLPDEPGGPRGPAIAGRPVAGGPAAASAASATRSDPTAASVGPAHAAASSRRVAAAATAVAGAAAAAARVPVRTAHDERAETPPARGATAAGSPQAGSSAGPTSSGTASGPTTREPVPSPPGLAGGTDEPGQRGAAETTSLRAAAGEPGSRAGSADEAALAARPAAEPMAMAPPQPGPRARDDRPGTDADPGEGGSGAAGAAGPRRARFHLRLATLGAVDLTAFCPDGRLELTLRVERPLPPAVRQEVEAIHAAAVAASGRSGRLVLESGAAAADPARGDRGAHVLDTLA